ncbi:MAG: DUF58 domain-containing protein [Desulfuromonadales bacterium]|nr:DUF58 domain-containing protein [Desulfuromonadales bacterium]
MLLGFAAVNTGNNLIYLIVSALLGFMSITGVLGKGNLDRLQVTILPPSEIYAGVTTLLTIRLRNQRRFLPGFLLCLTVGNNQTVIPYLSRQRDTHATVRLCLDGRGYHAAPAVTISSPFPVNFFVRARTIIADRQLLVFPAPLHCVADDEQGRSRPREGISTANRGSTGELRQISDYRGGEPVKLIHWRLSAKHGSLKVRELSATQREPLVIDLLKLPGRTIEEQLRQAVFLIDRSQRNGRPVGLKLPHVTIPAQVGLPHKHQLLTELALYGQPSHPA